MCQCTRCGSRAFCDSLKDFASDKESSTHSFQDGCNDCKDKKKSKIILNKSGVIISHLDEKQMCNHCNEDAICGCIDGDCQGCYCHTLTYNEEQKGKVEKNKESETSKSIQLETSPAIQSDKDWMRLAFDGIHHCAFCNSKYSIYENLSRKFIACRFCRSQFEEFSRPDRKDSIPLTELQEIKDELKKETAKTFMWVGRAPAFWTLAYKSIKDKIDKTFSKHLERLK